MNKYVAIYNKQMKIICHAIYICFESIEYDIYLALFLMDLVFR